MRRAALALLILLTAGAPGGGDFSAERARLAALNAREAALAAKIGANRTSLLRLLSALEMWRRDPPPALLVSPQRARDAARAAILMRAIAPELQRRAQALSVQAKALSRTRREAAEAGAALFAAESRGADRASGRASGRASARTGALDALLLTPQERQAQASARGDPLVLGLADASAATAPPPARLLSPLAASAPVRRFGEAWPGRGRSQGVAWAPPADAPVLAPADGEIEYAGPLRAWRLVVILRLAGGWRLVLAGMQRVDAPVGALVKAGEALGRTPPARQSAAEPPAELYMEVRRGAEPVDPDPLLAASARKG